MKNSSKTLTHQDNMEAANILMSQIECDLQRATEIKHPGWNDTDNVANWVFQNKNVNITYNYDGATGSEGIRRIVNDNGKTMNTVFSKGHPVKIKFTHYAKPTSIEKGNVKNFEKHGMWVEIEVGSKNKDIPPFTLLLLATGLCPPCPFFSINFLVIISIASVILKEFLALVSIMSIPVCFFNNFLSSSVTCISLVRSHLFPTINFIGLLSVYLFISSNQSLMCPNDFLSVTS
jgi:hypothetical protein